MAVIAPPRQPDSKDAESTVEPGRGGEALIEEAKQHDRARRRHVAGQADVEALIREARRRTRRRRATIGVAVVGVAAFIWAAVIAREFVGATGSAGTERAVTQVETVPANPVPSAELVASFRTHWSVSGRDALIYVYDDGRVLSAGPWDVRRLTPDGVELLRARIIASGVLGPNTYAEAPELWSTAFVQLRVDGVLTPAWQPPGPADDPEVAAFDRAVVQLLDFDAWLPTEAWAQPETVAYVPPGYAVCFGGEGPSFVTATADRDAVFVGRGQRIPIATTADREAVLALLPEDATAVLAASPRFEGIDPKIDSYAGSESSPSSDILGCRHLTPAQAQSVVDALVRAGWGVEDSGPRPAGAEIVLTERARIDTFGMWTNDPEGGRLGVTFLPILPHGVPECACVG